MAHKFTDHQPLAGVRVVDFGTFLAGPLVARILADAGAEVVHVDPPGGPAWDAPNVNALLCRGKEVLRLDLKSEAGRRAAWDLVDRCDVVIENFSRGKMDALGFGYPAVSGRNGRAVYLSMPGFASDEEAAWAAHAGAKDYEAVIMAATGVFCDMGLNRTLMGINPSFSPLPLASAYSSVLGSLAVTLALFDREHSGRGDLLTVPLAAGLTDSLVYNTMDVADLPPRYLTVREREIAAHKARAEPMAMQYEQVKALLDPFYCTYFCQDGRPFYVVAPCHLLHQRRCLQALGIWEEVRSIPTGDVYARTADWGDKVNCLLGTYPLTDPKWIVRLKKLMTAAFKRRTAQEWERIFGSYKIPGAATRTTKEWLRSEHALASGLVQVRNGTGPHTGGIGGGVRSGGAEGGKRGEAPRPTVLEAGPLVWHKRPVVSSTEVERRAVRQASLAAADRGSGSGWLRGIKILDLCNVIAGPVIGGTLARFGAEVVKIDPSKPTYDPLVAVFMGVPPNRGKKSALVDIKTPSGRAVLQRLVAWADVVLLNQVESQLRSLGVDEATLKATNPRVILVHFDAYGGPHFGPRSDFVGYDDLLQASTGIMARFGGSLRTPEEHAHLGTIDVVSGFSGALACAMALYRLRHAGEAGVARTSLAANAQLIQTPFMVTEPFTGRLSESFRDDAAMKPLPGVLAGPATAHAAATAVGGVAEPKGPRALGCDPLYRWYHTNDGTHINLCQDIDWWYATSSCGQVHGPTSQRCPLP